MNNIEVNIPYKSFKKDFTIIYKGKEEKEGQIIEKIEEIKTSKEELLRNLHYFKHRVSEINQMDEIYIHDSYNIQLFKEFIESLETHKILINDQNYSQISEMCHKYEYKELEDELATFSQTRPDLQSILDNPKIKELDSEKEEILSKSLDICIQNQNFINLPLPVLSRILNSPSRVLHDHQLLVEFIKKIIKKYKKENEDDETRNNIQIILSSLDYIEMSNDEIEYFLNNEEISGFFNFRHSKERMKIFIDESQKNEKRFLELGNQISNLEQQINEYKKSSEEKEKLMFNEIKKEINIYQSNQEKKLIEFESRLHDYEDLKNKFSQQEKMISKCLKENEDLRKSLSEQEYKFKSLEEKFRLQATISAKVESNIIKGTINITERISKLDMKRSKYILNTNGSQTLNESEYKSGTEITSLSQSFSISKTSGTYFLHALIVDNQGYKQELISEPLTIKIDKFAFDYTGHVQSVKLGSGTYKLEVWGSAGGENNESFNDYCTGSFNRYAGKGGYSVGTLKLNKETTLYVYVGGTSNSSNGGWNGGGSAKLKQAAGGGGSTDISLYGEEGSTNWNTANHLYSRIIVAGGGGGSPHTYYPQWIGGCGGGENGENSGKNQSKGGTQTSGYSFGSGQSITGSENSACGGGWYGGYGDNGGWGRGGGGGSGFVYNSSTATNYPKGCKLDRSFYLSNSATISGSSEFPTTSGIGTERGHSGNGYAVITLI